MNIGSARVRKALSGSASRFSRLMEPENTDAIPSPISSYRPQ